MRQKSALLALLISAAWSYAAEPDLTWKPEPFVFNSGRAARYIDFANGNDNNPGTKEQPWKHHPWDANATGNAVAADGIDTYCFRKGVIYRSSLVAKSSGTAERPIRLTVDPSWGEGEATLCGSAQIKGGWKQCTDVECPEIPEAGREKTWYRDLDKTFVPRLLWEVRGDEVNRIPIARTPNWTITNPDDPRSEWWEFTGCVIETKVYVDSTEGFQAGDWITGTGKWMDFDENRDNIAKGRNQIVEVGKDFITIASFAWKKGEIKTGATITNRKARAKVTKIASRREAVSRLIDDAHLTQTDPSYWVGATLWSEGTTMPRPNSAKVIAFDPKEHFIRIVGWGDGGAAACCRYYLENLPQLLDSPGEYCYAEKGEHAGRLFLRLPEDRDPNDSTIEAAREPVLLTIQNKSHIEVSGLDMRFSNAVEPGTLEARWARLHMGAVRMLGSCSHITVRNCTFSHVPYGVTAYVEKEADLVDHLNVMDNDLHDIDSAGIALSNGAGHYLLGQQGSRLIHTRVLRNRLRNVGYRALDERCIHVLDVEGGEVVEVAGNVVDKTWNAGIMTLNATGYRKGGVTRPLIRVRIHHNKATNTLLGLQDYGGIASWMAGPSYVYCNISGNAVGYKHHSYRTLDRKDWYRTSCYGVGIYIDGQYKGYVFNNVIWGKNNNVNDRIYNSCAFNEAMGFLNTVFNNTMYRFGVGLHKGMTQHNRCFYLGNLMLDMGHKFIQQEPSPSAIEYDSLAYAKNVFNGTPPNFGQLGSDVYATPPEWQKAMDDKKVMVAETGTPAPQDQVIDAKDHDFRPCPDSAAIGHGAKVFVPWSLYAVVGEWGFYMHRANPSVILGENINWNDEWYYRSMYQTIPRNDLTGHGIDESNFRRGTLEDWTEGAVELNGKDEYCEITDTELKRSYSWEVKDLPSWYNSKSSDTYDGAKRVTVDMAGNNFLVEVVLKTKPGLTNGGIVGKCGRAGYLLEIAESGAAKMSLYFGETSCSRSGAVAVNDGKWHHVIAEVDRQRPEGINLYVDGKLSNGTWSGAMDKSVSLANTAGFTVGKTTVGASAPTERYFAGQIDFLRVSRGTLADAETTIEELYGWEFDGPFLKDFHGRPRGPNGGDAGAVMGKDE